MKKNKTPQNMIFVARQPIFDRNKKIFAYELLFRSSFKNMFENVDGDYATSKVITNTFSVFGIDAITGGSPAFINFTRDLLIQKVATVFPSKLLGIEVLENIEPDESVVEACKDLKKQGYIIALDDFVLSEKYRQLIEYTDIIKIDFFQTKGEERKKVIENVGSSRIKFLAEKVETREEYKQAYDLGYEYFQGYFFCKPEIIAGKEVPGFKMTYLMILQEIHKAEVELKDLEKIIQRDVSITYKLLKFINSASFAFRKEISSISHALALLGLNEVRKWLSMIILSDMGEDKPQELIRLSVLRAKFCELLAAKVGMRKQQEDLFLMGLLSMIDAIIDKPLEEILDELAVEPEIKDALLGKDNKFSDVLSIVNSYNLGSWKKCVTFCKKMNLEEENIPSLYLESVEWSNSIFDVAN